MIANYFTIVHVAHHLDKLLCGWTATEAFTQHKGELVVRWNDLDSPAAETFLVAGCAPSQNVLFARKEFHRAKRNTLDVFPLLIGKQLARIRIHPADREVQCEFSDGLRLLMQLFGSRANVLLVDDSRTVLDSFLRPKELVGTRLQQDVARKPAFPDSEEEIRQRLQASTESTLLQGLKSAFPSLGTTLANEVC